MFNRVHPWLNCFSLTRAMREANGVKTRAADLLGYRNYQTLDNQLRRLNVAWEE